jgi:hypothetical protein
MKVSDLIAVLQQANPDYDVKMAVGYNEVTIDEVILNNGNNDVLVGNDIPSEMHRMDYKYDEYYG